MGMLVEGVWHDIWYDTKANDGKYIRQAAGFRNWITADGQPGPSGVGGFAAAAGRYHLYVSYACPWAHRTLILRKLKGLEEMISVSVVHWHMAEEGWTFAECEGSVPDTVNQARTLYEIYLKAIPTYSGRVTVPVLWDKQTMSIVSNESSEIIRMFNNAFDGIGARNGDYYPAPLRSEIDTINKRIYTTLNNGVYKCGFATSQAAYEKALAPLFETLDWLEMHLSSRRYLLGDQPNEADWRLFTTLVRFDSVYVGHFKCNLRRLVDYPNLWGYLRDLFQQPGIAQTVNFDHIKNHYYVSHVTLNPTRVVPAGPHIDFNTAHQRQSTGASEHD